MNLGYSRNQKLRIAPNGVLLKCNQKIKVHGLDLELIRKKEVNTLRNRR